MDAGQRFIIAPGSRRRDYDGHMIQIGERFFNFGLGLVIFYLGIGVRVWGKVVRFRESMYRWNRREWRDSICRVIEKKFLVRIYFKGKK